MPTVGKNLLVISSYFQPLPVIKKEESIQAFNPKVNLKLSVHEKRKHIAYIYDIRGNLVWEIDYGTLEIDTYDLEWNGLNEKGGPVKSGVYFFKIQAGEISQTKKMIMLK